MERKRRLAIRMLRETGSVVVALSGGVDSALLLALAAEALPRGRLLAATGRSEALSGEDLADAIGVARCLGVPHESVPTDELAIPGYRANLGDRCFHCRSELFAKLRELADRRGFAAIAYGAIADDDPATRPGMRAAAAAGILAPLRQVGLGKVEVRELARRAGLPVGDKPASPCLASRIPDGSEVTAAKLLRIERAERALRELGYCELRVRDLGELGRVELDAAGLSRACDPGEREALACAVRAAGFARAEIDLRGYRSGSATAGGGRPEGRPMRLGGQ